MTSKMNAHQDVPHVRGAETAFTTSDSITV